MTIDDLRARRRELLEQKQAELDLQAAGHGDNMALFMVNEELLDVNAQLRSLLPRHRIGSRRTAGAIAADRQQYMDWAQEDQSPDDTDDRKVLLRAASQGLSVLTPRQREVIDLHQSGMTQEMIAARWGVNKSTVNRTLTRAKRVLREETERAVQAHKLTAKRLDMADPAVAMVVLSALTPKQAAYLYLYYSEWLSLREIGELTGTDHSTILRTIQRALRNIGAVLGYQETTLENMDALDELAYQIYCETQDLDDTVPEKLRPSKRRGLPEPHRAAHNQAAGMRIEDRPPILVCTSYGDREWVHGRDVTHRTGRSRRGRLLSALLDRAMVDADERHPVFRWLAAVFRRIAKAERRGARWLKRLTREGET